MTPIVAGYARFSPDDATKISIEMQDAKIQEVCKARNWGFYKTFVDREVSGAVPPYQFLSKDEQRRLEDGENVPCRVGLTELLDEVPSGNFNMVMVYEVSRLARAQGLFWNIIEGMKEHSVVCATAMLPDITSDRPDFQMMAGVLQAVAAFQRDETVMKTRDALATLKRGNYAVGRPPLGFKYVPENPADPEHSHKRRELDELGTKAKLILEGNKKIKIEPFLIQLGLDPSKDYMTGWHLKNNVMKHLGIGTTERRIRNSKRKQNPS